MMSRVLGIVFRQSSGPDPVKGLLGAAVARPRLWWPLEKGMDRINVGFFGGKAQAQCEILVFVAGSFHEPDEICRFDLPALSPRL